MLLGAASDVEHTLTGPAGGGVLINAAVSRHAGTCLQVLQAFAAMTVLAPLVIVHCGNNGALGVGFVDQVMQIAGPHRNVMFVSLKVPRSWQDPDNAELAADVARYKNARLFNWNEIGSLLNPQNAYFYSDGYHLRPVGREYYAVHVLKALRVWHWLRSVRPRSRARQCRVGCKGIANHLARRSRRGGGVATVGFRHSSRRDAP